MKELKLFLTSLLPFGTCLIWWKSVIDANKMGDSNAASSSEAAARWCVIPEIFAALLLITYAGRLASGQIPNCELESVFFLKAFTIYCTFAPPVELKPN